MTDYAKLAGDFTARQIEAIARGERTAAATLARLRRGVGRRPGDMPALWETTLKGMPEELMSRDGEPTRGEWAAHTALTLYALHQQGRDPKTESMHRRDAALGAAIRQLAASRDDEERVKRRFDAAATADDVVELANHLRGIVQLLKASGIPLDYDALARDVYWYQFPEFAPSVRLRWGQDFYRVGKPEDNAETGKEDSNEEE